MCVCVADRHTRHRACALKDTMRSIIRDELDEDFERVCEEIKEARIKRGETSETGSDKLTETRGGNTVEKEQPELLNVSTLMSIKPLN